MQNQPSHHRDGPPASTPDSRRRRRVLGGLPVFALLLTGGPAGAQEPELDPSALTFRPLGEVDVARVAELHHLTDLFGEAIWPGFDTRTIPVGVNDDDRQELLVGHPDPPPEFRPFGDFRLDERPVLIRDGCTRYGPDGGGWKIDIGGEPSAYVSILQAGQDTEGYLALLLHECFHVHQARFQPDPLGPFEALPVLDAANSAMLALEARVLYAALVEPPENADALGALAERFVAVRHARRADFSPGAVNRESLDEYGEGTARYSEARLLQLLVAAEDFEAAQPGLDVRYAAFADAEQRLRENYERVLPPTEGIVSFFHAMYETGMAQCLVLDRLRPGWKEELREAGISQFHLLERELPMTAEQEAARLAEAREAFDHAGLLEQQNALVEEQRELLRGLLEGHGRRIRVFHRDLPGGFQWKPRGPVHEVPPDMAPEGLGPDGVIVWAGGFETFEKPGFTFRSEELPITWGRPFFEFFDRTEGGQGDWSLEWSSMQDGVCRDLVLTGRAFALEADRARLEEREDGGLDIHPMSAEDGGG